MFENLMKFFKKRNKKDEKSGASKNAAKERLHLVLMQDRANVSADFLELMKQEIIDVIKKYIDVDESAIDVRLTNKENEDGTNGAPALYANIPIVNIKNEARKTETKNNEDNKTDNKEENKEESKVEETIENIEEKIDDEIKNKYTDKELEKIKENAESIIDENKIEDEEEIRINEVTNESEEKNDEVKKIKEDILPEENTEDDEIKSEI
ncbi:MAG: cell division topological specificity factor MinE [Clostridia bacterium]|nr:cell division topological specificity factor MinE [Clostridia bacterium]